MGFDRSRKVEKAREFDSDETEHTHTHPFNGPFLGLPRSAGTRKVKPIWILLEQEIVSGSGISWAIGNLHLATDR